ncbi:MAG: polysaccharide deacetylase family protein, partial [Desulfuromusa sp.]|nr:polysaccharide deacetylase family protein [Desulfuromusa sp.]
MLKSLLLVGLLLIMQFVPLAYAAQVNTFIYHRFDETRYPSTNIAAEIFTQQLEYTKKLDIKVISLNELATRLAAGEELPDHAVSFCVDDAFRSFYDVGMPIIRRYGFPFTVFVNTDAVGTHGYLGWDELKELAAEGVTIGNHTANHAYLVEMQPGEAFSQWKQRIQADIEKSQQQFEKHLGFKPTLFAYPYGEYTADVVDIIKNSGFIAAFAQQSGVIHSGQNRYILPRFPMGGPFATFAGFKTKLAMKPLVVTENDPFNPVIQKNPPVLRLQIPGKQIDPRRFNCFVQGENRCWVEADKVGSPGEYKIFAEKPLTGRRNKYTLT